MTEKQKKRSTGSDWLGLASFGFFLVLIGIIWMVTPNLTSETENFIKDFHLENMTGSIVFPAPENVSSHSVVYLAAMQFCVIFGAFEIVILVLRFAFHDRLERKADAVSSMAFWFSASYFLNLLTNGSISWFSLFAGVIISGGLAIVASSLVKLLG
jgi:hypothetical protein